jgi:hypothetical protein
MVGLDSVYLPRSSLGERRSDRRQSRPPHAACADQSKYRVPSVVVLVIASQQSQLTLFTGVLIFGLVVGVFGHLIQSRALILTGILVIGLASGYFAFVLQPGSGA